MDQKISGTGGFMNPDAIVMTFGITPGMKIADFGCGTGYFTILAAQKTGEGGLVTALDILDSSLSSVKTKADNAGLRNIETVKANLEVLGSSGLGDKSQDLVLIANVLFQSEKKQEVFQEAKRVLKDGGGLIVIDWKPSVGGLGPPDDLKTDPNKMKSLAEGVGFSFVQNIDAGDFHYGIKFIL